MINVAFLGRGSLGFRILQQLLLNPQVKIKVIIACDPSDNVPLEKSLFCDLALRYRIPYYETNDINNEKYRKVLENEQLDLGIALLWLNTIDSNVIELFKHGILNLHAGDLPRYRGNACQTWAILNGETKIGVTCHLMRGGELDSGPICRKSYIEIKPSDNVGELQIRAEETGVELVLETVNDFISGKITLTEQDESQALFCFPRLPRDGEIDWNGSAENILRLIRAANKPYPGAYSFYRDKLDSDLIKKLVIIKAEIYQPTNKSSFCAVPGHIIHYPVDKKCGVVCGDHNVLLLNIIEIDGILANPWHAFRSVRQRLGLDVQGEIQDLWDRFNAILAQSPQNRSSENNLGVDELARHFLAHGFQEIVKYEKSIRKSIDTLCCALNDNNIQYKCNDLKNLSFSRRFYDWEQRERWFGIQIYQSVQITFGSFPINVGFWYWSDQDLPLCQRLYISLDRDTPADICSVVLECFKNEMGIIIRYEPSESSAISRAAFAQVSIGYNKRYVDSLTSCILTALSRR
jgi:methionyl-tRNA formyltransferase